MSAHCQRGDVPGREWEGWSLSLEALTEPVPGSEPPGLLGRTWQQSGSSSGRAAARGAVELLVFGPSQSLAS